MKMLVKIICPIEPFNSMVKDGSAGEVLGRIIEDTRPESIHFTEVEGCRGAIMVVEVGGAGDIPAIAEPWFLNFEAICEFRIAMTPDDLKNADLENLGKKWS
ncbi:MAG: panthothenate synthetase [Christiangramia sp.]|nr:panthothenate synthetase [Christiangramia sp.]